MKRRTLARSASLLVGATTLAVLAYNYWSWCCGRCTARTFLTPGPFGFVLFALTVLAALLLLGLKVRRLARLSAARCRCGAILAEDWRFCPRCGLKR